MKYRPSPPLARLLNIASAHAQGPIYWVGGSLRDALLGRRSSDLDLAVCKSAKPLAAHLAKALRGTLVVLDDTTRVYRVALPPSSPHKPWTQIDIAEIQGKNIQEDLMRRDFTINALAWPISEGANEILDPRGGLKDLKSKYVRAELPSVFPEDPLRLLRAFRFAAQLGFRIDAATLRQIKARRRLIRKPAGERIRHELLGILSSAVPSKWFKAMDQAGILTELFPELEKCRRCAVEYYGKGGVLRHSLETAARMDFLLDHLDAAFPQVAKDIRRYSSEKFGDWDHLQAILRLAALLHDNAKAATAKKIDGRLRFFGHDVAGALKAEKILKALRFSNDEVSLVSDCIRHHLRTGNLAANEMISDKAAFRFFKDVGRHGVPLLLVCWSDHSSYLTPNALKQVLPHVDHDPGSFNLSRIRAGAWRKTLHHLQVVGFLMRSYFQRQERIMPSSLIDGNTVMKTLKIKPGPNVGKALAMLQEAQAEGKVNDRQQALQFLKTIRL